MPLKLSEESGLLNAPVYENTQEADYSDDFDDLTILASAICQTPVAFISLTDGEKQWVKPVKGIANSGQQAFESLLSTYMVPAAPDIVIIEDVEKDERFAGTPFITGEGRLAFYAGIPLITPDGTILGSLCVIDKQKKRLSKDQTDALKIIAKQVVDKLELRKKAVVSEKTIQDLRDANLFTQKFAAMAAHDIKNPLSSMLLSAQAIKARVNSSNDEQSARLADMNISSTKRLIQLLDDMLAYSKKPSLLITEKQTVGLLDLLKNVMALIEIPPNVQIFMPAGNDVINVSTVAVEQIFSNLLTNAIRYNDKEHALVRIRFEQDDSCYYFEVEDNGRGIEEAYHKKIFGDSFTLKTADRYDQMGSGIGLSTVKEIIKKLNGYIRVVSVPGQGATFCFTINKA